MCRKSYIIDVNASFFPKFWDPPKWFHLGPIQHTKMKLSESKISDKSRHSIFLQNSKTINSKWQTRIDVNRNCDANKNSGATNQPRPSHCFFYLIFCATNELKCCPSHQRIIDSSIQLPNFEHSKRRGKSGGSTPACWAVQGLCSSPRISPHLHPNHVLVYCGSQKAGAFVDLNQPQEEAAALHPPQGAWLEITSGCSAPRAYELTWRRANVCRWV